MTHMQFIPVNNWRERGMITGQGLCHCVEFQYGLWLVMVLGMLLGKPINC